MNSPRKSQDSETQTNFDSNERFVRIQYLKSLFGDWTNEDPFLLEQIRTAIEASLRDSPNHDESLEAFTHAAHQLRQEQSPESPNTDCIHLDLRSKSFDPLFIRDELVKKLKILAGKRHIFVLVRGLKSSIRPNARKFSKHDKSQLNEASILIDSIAQRWSTPSSTIHLIYL